VPRIAQGTGVERVVVIEVLAVDRQTADERVVDRLLVEIGVLRVVVGEVHLPLHEDFAAARAGLAVGVLAQRVVRPEALGALAAADAAGQVVLAVDDVVPDRLDGALVVEVVRLDRDVGHA